MNDHVMPAWLEAHPDKPAHLIVRAPAAYRWALGLLQCAATAPPGLLDDDGEKPGPGCDQVWLDIAHRWIQWEAKIQAALAGIRPPAGGALVIVIKADGEKDVWAQRNAPAGKFDPASNDGAKGWRAILRQAVELWQTVRGLPVPQ